MDKYDVILTEKMKHTRQQTITALVNECRANNKPIDLSDQDLSGLDLSGLDLSRADLRGADLQEAYLRGANLQDAYLQDANLQDADLRGANLQRANLQRANLQDANFRGADLQEADFDFAGYELSCKTIGIKADKRLVSQLLYHLCCMDVQDCPEWDKLRNDKRLIALANKSHVIREHEQPEIEPLKAWKEK